MASCRSDFLLTMALKESESDRVLFAVLLWASVSISESEDEESSAGEELIDRSTDKSTLGLLCFAGVLMSWKASGIAILAIAANCFLWASDRVPKKSLICFVMSSSSLWCGGGSLLEPASIAWRATWEGELDSYTQAWVAGGVGSGGS